MIEINLLPDVKQELIQAKRVRTMVVSVAVVVGLAAIGIVVLLALYLYGVQTVRTGAADSDIQKKSKELSEVPDLSKMLTIQHQLSQLTELHNQTNVSSRFFDLLAAVNPIAPNQVSFAVTKIDSTAKTIRIEGQADNGYLAADVLKKTILGTSLSYKENDASKKVPLTEDVSMADLNYAQDSTGKKVLRFTLEFVYNEILFSRSSDEVAIVRPDRQNATDSFVRLPKSPFGDSVSSQDGGN